MQQLFPTSQSGGWRLHVKDNGIPSESHVLVRNIAFKVNVYSNSYSVDMGDYPVNSGVTVKDADLIGQIIENRQVMLCNNNCFAVIFECSNSPSYLQLCFTSK